MKNKIVAPYNHFKLCLVDFLNNICDEWLGNLNNS